MPLALPCQLVLPEMNPASSVVDGSNTISSAQLLLANGAGEFYFINFKDGYSVKIEFGNFVISIHLNPKVESGTYIWQLESGC